MDWLGFRTANVDLISVERVMADGPWLLSLGAQVGRN